MGTLFQLVEVYTLYPYFNTNFVIWSSGICNMQYWLKAVLCSAQVLMDSRIRGGEYSVCMWVLGFKKRLVLKCVYCTWKQEEKFQGKKDMEEDANLGMREV